MELEPGFKLSEAGPIPEDWDAPEMLAHLKQRATYGIVKAGIQSDVGVPMLRGGDIQDGRIGTDLPCVSYEKSQEFRRTILQEGDVVISLVGYPGESAQIPPHLIGSNISRAVGLLRPAQSLRPDFLVSYLNSTWGREQTLRPSAGSAQIVVNLDALNKLPIPTPSWDEQHVIASALTDVNAWIVEAEAEANKLASVQAAAMDVLLTSAFRLKNFTGEWDRRRFGDLVEIRNRKVPTFGNQRAKRCVDLENIYPKSGSLIGFVDVSGSRLLRYSFEPGDILFGRLRAYLEKYWTADCSGVCSTEIWPLIPKSNDLAGELLAWLVRTPYFIEAASVSFGTHMPRADWAYLSDLEVVVPPTLAEQHAIAAVLSDIDAALAAAQAVVAKARAVKAAAMDALLSGRVRLPSFDRAARRAPSNG